VSIGRDLSTVPDRVNTDPVRHRMLYDQDPPVSALDSFELSTHGFAIDPPRSITHVFWHGDAYNGHALPTC